MTDTTGIDKARETAAKLKAKPEEVKNESKTVGTTVKPETSEAQNAPTEVGQVEQAIEVVKPAELDQKTGQLILTPKHIELIKKQIAVGATQSEFELFLMMAYRTKLDPLMRQLYFIKYGANVSYITSIDGYRIIASRTGEFAGVDEPRFEYSPAGQLTHCAVTVYRFVGGQKVGFSAKVKFSEYTTGINQWKTKPETMIAKVAESHALRKAFPNDLSGVYTQDEMDQAEPKQAPVKPPEPATKFQIDKIYALVDKKGADLETMIEYIKANYKKAGVTSLSLKQANHLIAKLEAKPDAENYDPINEQTETMPDEEMEAIDAAIMANKENTDL